MTEQKKRSTGWMCVEERTDARDGTYIDKAIAECMCGFLQATWRGSVWNIVPDYRGDGVGVKFHADEPMNNRLISLYGPENYEAADAYDKVHRGE